ncbi:MAG TPA: MFS transporter [Solirubrobacteraceae bacterium]|nr:MFS transporter [Solirubrobacteraceae bacterium]
MLARYRAVLATPGSLRLYLTGVFARLPQGMSGLATLLLVREATRSYALAGLAVGIQAVTIALVGPLQGRLVDRYGRAPVLVPWATAQAALFVALVECAHAHVTGAVLVVISAAIGAALPAIAPAVRALLRAVIVEDAAQEAAYALESVIQELIWITGPLVVGIVIAVGSPSLALIVCAGLSLAGTILFVTMPASRARPPVPAQPTSGGLRALPELRALLVPIALMGFAIGSTEVGLPSLALHAGSRASTGLLLAVWSLGSMLGGLLHGSRDWNVGLSVRYQRLLAGAVLCAAPLMFAHTIQFGLLGALLTGLTIAPVFSCQYALVGRIVPEGAETEAFTWMSSALVGGIAGGSALAGALIGPGGVGAPFIVSCGALAVAALASVRARRLTAVA